MHAVEEHLLATFRASCLAYYVSPCLENLKLPSPVTFQICSRSWHTRSSFLCYSWTLVVVKVDSFLHLGKSWPMTSKENWVKNHMNPKGYSVVWFSLETSISAEAGKVPRNHVDCSCRIIKFYVVLPCLGLITIYVICDSTIFWCSEVDVQQT